MPRALPVLVVIASSSVAAAETAPATTAPATTEPPPAQLQIDAGLSVIGLGYEQPVTPRIAVMAEAFVFGSYFLPWFDLGPRTVGVGGGLRATWFARPDASGFYVTPYARLAAVGAEIEDADAGTTARGRAITAGVFAGWAFRLAPRIDLRLGLGAQYIRISLDRGSDASTPFVAIDGLIGFRL